MTPLRERWPPMRRAAGDALDAVGALGPLFRLRQRWLAARVPLRGGGTFRGLPLPPARLRVMVDGSGRPRVFHGRGVMARNMILRTLAKEGVEIESFASILDFGCGCGRVARHWSDLRGPELHGCDYNPELVAWCREHLGFMEVRQNGLEPPLPYEGGSFDFVYAISVLTHLTEPLGLAWLDDLARVLRPGGLLLVTTHGKQHRDRIPVDRRAAFDRGELVVLRSRTPGTNACAAFHPRPYLERQLAARFASVRFYGDGASLPFRQDVYVARRQA